MELLFMFFAGFIVLFLSVVAILKGTTSRVTRPANELKGEVDELNKRINELEKKLQSFSFGNK